MPESWAIFAVDRKLGGVVLAVARPPRPGSKREQRQAEERTWKKTWSSPLTGSFHRAILFETSAEALAYFMKSVVRRGGKKYIVAETGPIPNRRARVKLPEPAMLF